MRWPAAVQTVGSELGVRCIIALVGLSWPEADSGDTSGFVRQWLGRSVEGRDEAKVLNMEATARRSTRGRDQLHQDPTSK